jgi:uncharacterized protein YbaR (Trm112 family)
MDQVFTNKTSMSIVTCPVCHRAITVFMDTAPESEMCCPLCNSEFSFQDVLDAMPPMLQLAAEVRNSQELQLQPEDAKFTFDEIPAPPVPRKSTAAARRRKRKSESESSKRTADLKNKGPWDTKTARKRKAAYKKADPMREGILFVIGGLMALPVGQLLIWWVLGKDPLNFGPPVSSVAGFVVPEKFHGNKKDNNEVDGADSENDIRTKTLPDALPLPKKDPDAITIDPIGGGGELSAPKSKEKKKNNTGPPDG